MEIFCDYTDCHFRRTFGICLRAKPQSHANDSGRADCGNFSAIKRCYQKQKKTNRESEILIWVDRDIYVRSKVEIEAYAKKKNIHDFFFFDDEF